MDPQLKENLSYHFHNAVNLLVTISIFVLLYLIAAKVIKNLSSLLSIITI